MPGLKSVLVFLIQSVIVGLAAAFLLVLARPEWLPSLRPGTATGPESWPGAVKASAPAVANIYTARLVRTGPTRNRFGGNRQNNGLGSAVVIDPQGYLVTNYHVVAAADQIRVQLADGRVAEPSLVGVDAETDLALLKVDLGPIPSIPLGRSDQLEIGDVVLAIGNPYGLSNTVTQGIVSATGRGLGQNTFENWIQTDAAINEGNSGGALINTAGELVGINTAILAQDSTTAGISFAIPVNLVRGVVRDIQENGRVIRGWLGLWGDDLGEDEKARLGLDDNIGIALVRIADQGPAAAAGLQRGDILKSINGEDIFSWRQAQLQVAGLRPGDKVIMSCLRSGKTFEVTATAGERPSSPQTVPR